MTAEEQSALALLMLRGIAAARVAIGVVATVAPGAASRFQFGAAPATQRIAVRMLGARDLALGLGALLATRHGTARLRGWAEAGALVDAIDAAAFLRAGRRTSTRRRGLTALTAASSAACAAWAARRLPD